MNWFPQISSEFTTQIGGIFHEAKPLRYVYLRSLESNTHKAGGNFQNISSDPGITIDEFIESLMFMKSRAHPLDIVGPSAKPISF